MSIGLLLSVVFVVGAAGYALALRRAGRSVDGELRKLHSRPFYHGAYVACWAVLPAVLLMVVWSAVSPVLVSNAVRASMPEAFQAAPSTTRQLTMSVVQSVADGLARLSPEELDDVRSGRRPVVEALSSKGVALAVAPQPYQTAAAVKQLTLARTSALLRAVAAILLSLIGLVVGLIRVRPALRARNSVESVILAGLAAASLVAILTTVGIALSMLFETLSFFKFVPIKDFLFGTVWDPRFSAVGRAGGAEGQFGLLPLLWGTLYISLVALSVAVPIGLFSAIYMSEYATPRVRSWVKPLLEVLAGIPTIVYGFFALITFGPFIRDAAASIGVQVSATSVLTAGFIMGVMLIPFVSSLSDDIINAVPQTLRDGSFALGATQSETIKKVVLPAALPGIVGAVLLAASRAIGETMIVVLAAGIAANLTLNPLEPVTTMTVKIVSQLTGDLEFNSPQTLVAFALGLTLFVITLALNVYALYVVRHYREQYE